MFQLIGYIYNNTLTLFTLDCLHTKQIPSWHEDRHMFKKERAICPTVIWIYTGKSHSLSWIKTLQRLCPWRKLVSQKTRATNTPVTEIRGIFWFQCITTVFLRTISPTSCLGLWTGTWVCLSGSPATIHKLLKQLLVHFFTFQNSCFSSAWSEINKLNTSESSSGSTLGQNIAGGQQWKAGLKRRSSLQDFFFLQWGVFT